MCCCTGKFSHLSPVESHGPPEEGRMFSPLMKKEASQLAVWGWCGCSPKPRSLCTFCATVPLPWLLSSWSSMAASLQSSRKHSRQQDGGRRRLIPLPLQNLPEIPTQFGLHSVGQNVATCHDEVEKRLMLNLLDVNIPPRINLRFCEGRE